MEKFRMKTFFLLFISIQLVLSMDIADNKEKGKKGKKEKKEKKPNIVLFLADDVGYGDISFSGHPTVYTPNLDELARDGLFFTRFYVTAPTCSPSRASILTGKYPVRNGVYGVFSPLSLSGLPLDLDTMSGTLKSIGYATHIVGKWHLGVGENFEYMPWNYGFDDGVLIPDANSLCDCNKANCFPSEDPDNAACAPCLSDLFRSRFTSCSLLNREDGVIEQPHNLIESTDRFVGSAKNFIDQVQEKNKHRKKKDKEPFFLFFPFIQTHVPYYNNEKYYNKSVSGVYGDQMAELDGAVGEIVDHLKKNKILDDTIIFFTSDNGPETEIRGEFGGSTLLYQCGKYYAFEGGVRVPGIAHWPKKIKRGRTNEMVSSMDLYPTFLNLIGEADKIPADIDGVDQSDLFLGKTDKSARDVLYSFAFVEPKAEILSETTNPFAIYYKNYKAHFSTRAFVSPVPSDLPFTQNSTVHPLCQRDHPLTQYETPLLYNLDEDPEERWDLSVYKDEDSKIAEMIEIMKNLRQEMLNKEWIEDETAKLDFFVRGQVCCNIDCKYTADFPQCCDCVNKPSVK